MRLFFFTSSLLICTTLSLGACSKLDDPSLAGLPVDPDKHANPKQSAALYNKNRQLLFGDLHIHTGLSTDAYILGVRTAPTDVYRFSRGEIIQHAAGYPVQISRPLDFAAVTDHAEYIGQARLADLDIPTNNQTVAEMLRNSSAWKLTLQWFQSTSEIHKNGFSPDGEAVNKAINRNAWQQTIAAAEQYYEPGVFTTFIGYEWSADAGDITAHLHRNVIYRGNNVAEIPFSSLDSKRPEDLWRFLDAQNKLGKVAFAIPHNANFSRGYMYATTDSNGNALSADYALMRNRYEPISEILQIKGSSETHPMLSAEDEYADFELLGESLFTMSEIPASIKGSYSRDALRTGMELSHSEGFNPFRFGVIGASDSHNATSPSDEDNYTGKLPLLDGSAGLRTNKALLIPDSINPVTRWGSGGLAGVWAEENTRESVFDALQRKETFATSGPRISLRFFAGWNFDSQYLQKSGLIESAYANGVAMGGNLSAGPVGKAPGFLIMATKDPAGANLDRVQVIKAWLGEQGASFEKVFDVAAADDRTIDPISHKLPAVGSTVKVREPSYTNTIGGSSINVFWQDPEFEPNQQALYYVRVLEIPTPRWSTYDAARLKIPPLQPTSIQERAISSAIWYSPAPES